MACTSPFRYKQNYIIKITRFFWVLWALFGIIWSRPDNVITGTNFMIWQSELTFVGWLSKNQKKPVFVSVCIPFSYPDKYFHNFKNFPETLVNISKHIPNCCHYFLNCERAQIGTNTNFGYVMTPHEVYVGEYFQIFGSKTEKLFPSYGVKRWINQSINESINESPKVLWDGFGKNESWVNSRTRNL